MKKIVEAVIRMRNPKFSFHPHLNSGAILSFVWQQSWNLLRGLKWLFYMKKPKAALMGKRVKIWNAARIRFGWFLKVGDGVELSALGREGITLGNNVGIGAYSRVVVSMSFDMPGEYIRIGNNVGIGEFAYLGGAGGLEIGDDCIVGQYLSCHPENHITHDLSIPIRHQGVTRKGIVVGSNCWIGSKVTILDGVTVGEGSIIAAGAVVTKSFPANSVIGGVPAKLLKVRT